MSKIVALRIAEILVITPSALRQAPYAAGGSSGSSNRSGMGMEVDLRKVPQSGLNWSDFILFSESQSRFVVTIDPSKKKAFESLLGDAVYGEIGAVSKDENFHLVGLNGKEIIKANINDLKEAWQKPLRF